MVINQVITDKYAIYNGDAMEVMQILPSESIHLSIYSPPFATKDGAMYQYSSDVRDLSNADNYAEFFVQYRFFVEQIHRLTLPGRMTAVHCIDIPSSNTGNDYLIDFPGDIIRLHQEIGFNYTARHCIWKEPLGVRNRTMAKNLAHATIVDDSTKCANAGADFLLIFRKKGENVIPVKHPTGISYYAGERVMPAELLKYKNYTGNQIENRYSHWIWRQYASSFWDDIRLNHVLPFKPGKDDKDEKHVHPLQLDVIDRCCELYSNIGENVLEPFMGVGSGIYGPVSYGRKGIGIELKESYFNQAVTNLRDVENRFKTDQSKLFNDEMKEAV
jgi:DNA modification methylase